MEEKVANGRENNTHTDTHTHTHTYIYIYIHTHIYMYTYIYICVYNIYYIFSLILLDCNISIFITR